jgi:hypothetical protein
MLSSQKWHTDKEPACVTYVTEEVLAFVVVWIYSQ